MAAILQACSSDEPDSINAYGNRIKSYESAEDHPSNVVELMKVLEGLAPRCSIKEFEAGLTVTGVVEVPYGHFKDWEYYWKVKSHDRERPDYVLAGAFLPNEESELIYATINLIENPGGSWRTVWSIEYLPDELGEETLSLIVRD